jgi:hypothetical protein
MKITLTIIFSIFILTLVASSIYLAYNNRASEALWSKFLPALTIALVGACLTLWFSLSEEKINKTLHVSYATQVDTGSPLEVFDLRYSMFYGGRLFAPRGFLKPLDNQEIFDYHFDIALIEISELIFETFQEFRSSPGGDLVSSKKYPKSLNLSRKALEWDEFISKFKKSPELISLYSSIEPAKYLIHNMTLPKNTQYTVTNSGHKRSIVFTNNFVKVDILVFQSQGQRGLSEWQWLLGYDKSINEQFWQSNFAVHLKAVFNKLRSGHPDMPKYKDWVDSIFDNIQSNLDAESQLIKAREYNHLYQDNISNFLPIKQRKESNKDK